MIERFPDESIQLYAPRNKWLVGKNRTSAIGGWWVLAPHWWGLGRNSAMQWEPDFPSAIAYADRMARRGRA